MVRSAPRAFGSSSTTRMRADVMTPVKLAKGGPAQRALPAWSLLSLYASHEPLQRLPRAAGLRGLRRDGPDHPPGASPRPGSGLSRGLGDLLRPDSRVPSC